MLYNSLIETLNNYREVRFAPIEESTYEGTVNVSGNSIKLRIEFGKGYPNEFPTISIVDEKCFVPHASLNGKLCLFDEESVMIKPNMGEQLLLDSFDRAIEILGTDVVSQKKEVLREFVSYWQQQTDEKVCLFTNIPSGGEDLCREFTVIGSSLDRLLVSNTKEESKCILSNNFLCNPSELEKYSFLCTEIRLDSLKIPRMKERMSWEFWRGFIINNVSPKQKKQVVKLFSEKKRHISRFLILSMPSEYGDQYACLWISYNTNKKRTTLLNVTNCKVIAVKTIRIDLKHMLARGGADAELINKSVLLIGCGSIGGFVAENLCQCGVGTLDILDKDTLSVDNVHRHILGFNDAITGKSKAVLMKNHLDSRFIHADIDSLDFVERTAEAFIRDSKRLKKYDLIVSATGNPSINLAIDNEIKKLNETLPFVVCFNEPYGIGGHVVVVQHGGSLRKFYTDPISGELTAFLGSLTEANQLFAKSLSGCSGTFVEYSVLDSQQTAVLTSRLIIDVLLGKCHWTRLATWIGSDERLISGGFKTSAYYDDLRMKGLTTIQKDFMYCEGTKDENNPG